MLGQIERGESSPTISTLWKIASGFRVSFSTLFDSQKPVQGELRRDSGESVWGDDSAGMQARLIFPYDPLLGFEMFIIELAPGAISESTPHAEGVVEHIVVIEGEMELRIDEHWQTLGVGEGLRFSLTAPTQCVIPRQHVYAFMMLFTIYPARHPTLEHAASGFLHPRFQARRFLKSWEYR